MKYLKKFESYSENSLSVLSEINIIAAKYGMPDFNIGGQEKEGKWYKDIFKSDITFFCKFDKRKNIGTHNEHGWTHTLSIGIGKNKEKKRNYTSDSKYYTEYNSWYTRQLGGGYQVQKMNEETEGFENIEDAVRWCYLISIGFQDSYPYAI